MSQLHFIGGEKGGVGKTVMARVLAQYFIDHQWPFTGFDTEQNQGAFTRFYRDFAVPAPIDHFEGLDQIAEIYEKHPGHYNVLVDLAARTADPLARWIEESELFDLLTDMNVQPYFWHVMENVADSVSLLTRLLDTYGTNPSYVLVLNEGRSESFDIFEHSDVHQRALEIGANIIHLPRLHENTMTKVDRNNASFWGAIHNEEPAHLTLSMMERRRAKTWLARAYEQLEKLDFLNPNLAENNDKK
ncbi:MAG: mobilization protein [Pseudomonadota bacterium]